MPNLFPPVLPSSPYPRDLRCNFPTPPTHARFMLSSYAGLTRFPPACFPVSTRFCRSFSPLFCRNFASTSHNPGSRSHFHHPPRFPTIFFLIPRPPPAAKSPDAHRPLGFNPTRHYHLTRCRTRHRISTETQHLRLHEDGNGESSR